MNEFRYKPINETPYHSGATLYDSTEGFNLSLYFDKVKEDISNIFSEFSNTIIDEVNVSNLLKQVRTLLDEQILQNYIYTYTPRLNNRYLEIYMEFTRVHFETTYRLIIDLLSISSYILDIPYFENIFNGVFILNTTGYLELNGYMGHPPDVYVNDNINTGIGNYVLSSDIRDMQRIQYMENWISTDQPINVSCEGFYYETKEDTYEKIKKAVENIGKDKK